MGLSVAQFFLLSNGGESYLPFLPYRGVVGSEMMTNDEKHVEKYNALCKFEGLSNLRLKFPPLWAGLP